MKKTLLVVLATFLLLSATSMHGVAEVARVGATAPNFTLKNAKGEEVSLKNFIGKTVVLEWFNPGCPFVKKFYSNGDMPRFQKSLIEKGGVWLTISSSAEGRQGHISQEDAEKTAQEHSMQSTALLLDSDGSVGKMYGARTTPHMFVIDPKGALAYAGAIDNVPSTRASDIASATNHVLAAVDAIASGKTPTPADTEPYGCSVKYAIW